MLCDFHVLNMGTDTFLIPLYFDYVQNKEVFILHKFFYVATLIQKG